MYPEPFLTVWIEFGTETQALRYYERCPFSCRFSGFWRRSIDVIIPGHAIPTRELLNLPGVAKRPESFYWDPKDGNPFYPSAHRSLRPAA